MHNPAAVLENDTHKFLWDFDVQTDHLISARRPDLIIINKKKKMKKKKRICKIVDFAVPADHRIKLKKFQKKDKYLDLARELKKLWNMKVTIIPIVIGIIGGRVETIQITALLRTARNWEDSWRLEETCCHSNSSERPSANADVKNSKGVNNDDNNIKDLAS